MEEFAARQGFTNIVHFTDDGISGTCFDRPGFLAMMKEVANMKIKLNPDQEIVNTIREGLKRTGGYCPCRREHTEATKCMCQEFKDQIADPGFEGFCHCMLYYKSLQD